jgi:ABC-2 type transport system permease protein
MSRRIGALVLRYLLLIRRDYSRIIDLVYWPLLDIAVWGLFTFFLWRAQMQLPNAMAMLLGGAILWNVFLRAAQDVSVSFLDDVHARSVVTIFASPLTFAEFGTAVILRFGGRWQILAWSLPFAVMPVSCVFYPIAVLPPALRAVASAIPATHVFEGMRAVLLEHRMAWDQLAWATVINLAYLALAASLVAWVLRIALERGLLPKIR